MAWPVRNWATSSFPFQEKASNNRILEAFTWFYVLLNINQPQLKRFSLISTTGPVIHTRNTNFCIACIHFQCHSMLFPFLKYDIGQVSPYRYSKNVKRSSTARKIKDILLKLAFQTPSKFTACPQPTLQTCHPLLYYVDNCPEFNHCLTLPYSVCLQMFVFFHLLDEPSLCPPRTQSPHLHLPYLLAQGHPGLGIPDEDHTVWRAGCAQTPW